MRQAGVIAAPGIYAMQNMVSRLQEDHDNAKRLAVGLSDLGLGIDITTVQTNLVMADTTGIGMREEQLVELGKKVGVLFFTMGYNRVRMVTHYGITRKDVDEAIARLETVLSKSH